MANENNSGMTIIVAIVATIAILAVAFYAVQAYRDTDADGTSPNVDIELNGDAAGGSTDSPLY